MAVLEASIIIMHVVTCQALCPDHVAVLIVGQKNCETKVYLVKQKYILLLYLLACTCVYLCVCLYVCIMCVLPGVVAIKIQFNVCYLVLWPSKFNSMCVTWCCVCYLVLFVCLLAKQANIQTQHQVTHIELNELNEHTNNTR